MSEPRWTLVVVPPGSRASRVIEVSQTLMKLGAGVGAVLVLAALLLGYGTLSRSISISNGPSAWSVRTPGWPRKSGELHGRVDALSDTLRSIAERDARIRLLANLEPIDPQVQAAGIGGPAPEGTHGRARRPASWSGGPRTSGWI